MNPLIGMVILGAGIAIGYITAKRNLLRRAAQQIAPRTTMRVTEYLEGRSLGHQMAKRGTSAGDEFWRASGARSATGRRQTIVDGRPDSTETAFPHLGQVPSRRVYDDQEEPGTWGYPRE